MFCDGGTVSFEAVGFPWRRLRGGFDGRIEGARNDFPKRCFVGASHASKPGARLLPLHGREERALVRELEAALKHQLPFGLWRRVLEAESHDAIPKGVDGGLWQLARAVDARRRKLDQVDRGDWFGREAMRAEAGAVELVELAKDSPPGAEDEAIRVAVRIQRKQTFLYSFPSAPSGWSGPSLWFLAGKGLDCRLGSSSDRQHILWTLSALENPATASSPLAKELADLLERRLRRIREDDERH